MCASFASILPPERKQTLLPHSSLTISHAAAKPRATRIYVAEPESGTSLTTAFKERGVPKKVPYTPSFIDAAGPPLILPEMWDLARRVIDGTIVVSLREVCDAISLLVERNCVVAEGAGALSLAAALSGKAGKGIIVCIVSGGILIRINWLSFSRGRFLSVRARCDHYACAGIIPL